MKPINTIKDKELLTILLDTKREVSFLFGDTLRYLVLFGSYARQQQDPESDIDIIILADENEEELRKKREKVADIMAELSMKYDRLISITQVPYKRYEEYLDVLPFYKTVSEEGIEIYGRKAA